MEQKRTAPRAQKTQPLTYREWKRRKQLRLARNWVLFLAGCALVVFLLTKGILWLLPHLHGADGPQTFAASAYDSTGYFFDADDARLVLVNANLPFDEDIQFSGLGAVCSKAVRKDNGTTLLLTIELQDAGEIIGTVDAAGWAERGIGRWKKAQGASAYLVMLYRDAKRVGHPHRTSAEQYDFVPLMQTAGVYHFKVIPLTKQGKRGQAAESAWRKVTEAEAAQNREEWGGKKPGWQPEGEIPSYILKDGAYPQMDSLLIGEKYEQFNEKGENVSRTVIF